MDTRTSTNTGDSEGRMNCRLRRVTTCQCMVAQNKAKNVAYNMITFFQNQAHKDENEKVLGNNVEGGRIASGPAQPCLANPTKLQFLLI